MKMVIVFLSSILALGSAQGTEVSYREYPNTVCTKVVGRNNEKTYKLFFREVGDYRKTFQVDLILENFATKKVEKLIEGEIIESQVIPYGRTFNGKAIKIVTQTKTEDVLVQGYEDSVSITTESAAVDFLMGNTWRRMNMACGLAREAYPIDFDLKN